MTTPIYEEKNIATFNKPPWVVFDWILTERSLLIPVHQLDKDMWTIQLLGRINFVSAFCPYG